MDLISRDKAQDAVFSKENIMGYMDNAEDGDINRTVRSAIRLIERVPSAFDGMTNGEVMQVIFPNIELGETRINRKRYFLKGEAIETFDLKVHDNWWNAPYQKGDE